MPEGHPVPEPSLEAKSPFELRVSLGKNVPESDVRSALATGDMGFLHSFTTGSAVDGPGIRVVAWTAGCMWRCLYCHNPDTWTMTNGIPVTVEKATETLRKYRHGLKVMSGGFTLSGGEPLMQHRFAVKLLAAAKANGNPHGARFATATTATASATTTSNRSTSCCSISRRQIPNGIAGSPAWMSARRGSLPNVSRRRRRPIWVRYVLVPGVTDDIEDIEKTAGFAGGLGNVARVDVLPFHQMGKYKWKQLGMEYTLRGRGTAVSRIGRARVRGVPCTGAESVLSGRDRRHFAHVYSGGSACAARRR